MKFSSFSYLCKQGWHSMMINRLMTLASIGVLTACLIITGVAALLGVNINSFVSYLGSQNCVEVFIEKDATQDEIDALGGKISALDNIANIEFVSKEQAMQEMMRRMDDYADLLEGYTGENAERNPLNASYRVTVADIENMAQTVEQIRQIETSIYTIKSPAALTRTLINMQHAVTWASWALVLVLGLVSVVVISNTIRLTCFARRKEINIMKYVGATNTFIRMPFFVEGMTVGAVSGLLSTGIVCGLYELVLQMLHQPSAAWLTEFASSFYTLGQIWWIVLLGFVAFGVFIGGVGCITSIRKHLKV